MSLVANGAKEKLAQAFDNTQAAFERWCEAKAKLEEARREENSASTRYSNAKLEWERTLKTCSPGDIGTEGVKHERAD